MKSLADLAGELGGVAILSTKPILYGESFDAPELSGVSSDQDEVKDGGVGRNEEIIGADWRSLPLKRGADVGVALVCRLGQRDDRKHVQDRLKLRGEAWRVSLGGAVAQFARDNDACGDCRFAYLSDFGGDASLRIADEIGDGVSREDSGKSQNNRLWRLIWRRSEIHLEGRQAGEHRQ